MAVRFVIGSHTKRLCITESKGKLQWQDLKDWEISSVKIISSIYCSKHVEIEKFISGYHHTSQERDYTKKVY